MNNTTTQTTVKPKSKYTQALLTASRLLQAKLIRDERNKKLCVCLEVILDNGRLPGAWKALAVSQMNKKELKQMTEAAILLL